MKKILTILAAQFIAAMAGGIQDIKAQPLPDTVRLSGTDMKIIYRSRTDTLGFRMLSSKTSLKEYKKNRPVIRTLQSIKSSLESTIIFGTIAGTPISDLQGVSYPDCLPVLRSPQYRLTSGGVILIGKRDYLAAWNDMATHWETVDCYFIPYDGRQTELIYSLKYNSRKPLQEWDASCQIVSYRYPGQEQERDSLSVRTPPAFDGTPAEFEEGFRMYTEYSGPAVKTGNRGDIAAAFTVNPDKSVDDIRMVKSLDPYTNHAVMSFIRDTKGKWIPGTVDGEAVPVEVVLSATFTMIENIITIPAGRKEQNP